MCLSDIKKLFKDDTQTYDKWHNLKVLKKIISCDSFSITIEIVWVLIDTVRHKKTLEKSLVSVTSLLHTVTLSGSLLAWISVSSVQVWRMNTGCGSPLFCARQTERMPISFSTIQSSTVNIDKCCNLERQPSISQRNSAVKLYWLNWNFAQLVGLTHAWGIEKTMRLISQQLRGFESCGLFGLCFLNWFILVQIDLTKF